MECYKPGTKVLYAGIEVTITSVTMTPNGYYYCIDWISNGSPYSINVYECQLTINDTIDKIGFKYISG